MEKKSEQFIDGLTQYSNKKIKRHRFLYAEKNGILKIKFIYPKIDDNYEIKVEDIPIIGLNKIYEDIISKQY